MQIPDYDGVRTKYTAALSELTGRPVIVYETAWLQKPAAGPDLSIQLEDVQGLMEACHELEGDQLDLVLHSPGGFPEATDSVVRYLRKMFVGIRVFIPHAAMSAATMLALACDEIVMGKHSQLGPIDPQLSTPQGNVPVRAILDQFERARDEAVQDPAALGVWLPTLQQLAPALVVQCENAEKLAKDLVRAWLTRSMFADDEDPAASADTAVNFFADHTLHKSHGAAIDRDDAREVGLKVSDLEADQGLQDAVLSVHHAMTITFQQTGTIKMIENHRGRRFAKASQQVQVQLPVQMDQPGAQPLPPPPESTGGPVIPAPG